MVLQLPGWCPLEQLSRSSHADLLSDGECHWRIVYNSIQQILSECKSSVALSDFECLLGTEWLSDSVIAVMIDCLKRGIPLPVSDVASTLEPASRWRILGQRARCIDLDEVCILDSAMGRRILIASRTRDYGDVLRVFSKQCKFKTVRRILLPLNISWEGISWGTGCHWILAELHLETGKVHLYDWFKKTHDQYEIVAGLAPCNTATISPHTPHVRPDMYTMCTACSTPEGTPRRVAQAM
jgi:hypothetical protein